MAPRMFGKYEATPVREGESPEWERYRIQLRNQWEVSVVRHPEFSIGGRAGLWEAATLPPVGHAVDTMEGWLDEAGVAKYVRRVRRRVFFRSLWGK